LDEPLPHPADRLLDEFLEPDPLEHRFGIDVPRLKLRQHGRFPVEREDARAAAALQAVEVALRMADEPAEQDLEIGAEPAPGRVVLAERILLQEPIKQLGTFPVVIQMTGGIRATIQVVVESEGEPAS